MTYKAKVHVCSEIPTKHSTQSEHHVEFLNVKNLVIRKETARLSNVKEVQLRDFCSLVFYEDDIRLTLPFVIPSTATNFINFIGRCYTFRPCGKSSGVSIRDFKNSSKSGWKYIKFGTSHKLYQLYVILEYNCVIVDSGSTVVKVLC